MKTCSVNGCARKHFGHSLCHAHYLQERRRGKVFSDRQNGLPINERLARRSKVDQNTGCIEWTGYKNKKGYGVIKIKNKVHLAHRVAWELANGPIPDALLVLHKCDNPSCINPAHLFTGSNADNMADMVKKGRQNFPKGSRHPNAILSESVVREIKLDNRTQEEIARSFEISRSHISNIKRGAAWSHLA